jgi:hypothetical protein
LVPVLLTAHDFALCLKDGDRSGGDGLASRAQSMQASLMSALSSQLAEIVRRPINSDDDKNLAAGGDDDDDSSVETATTAHPDDSSSSSGGAAPVATSEAPAADEIPPQQCLIEYSLGEEAVVLYFFKTRFLSTMVCVTKQCCGSEVTFFGFGSKKFFGIGFYTSGKGNLNFLKYRQSVLHEDVFIKLKFLPGK